MSIETFSGRLVCPVYTFAPAYAWPPVTGRWRQDVCHQPARL